MIFVDSNVPMYLVGAPDPNRAAAQRRINDLSSARERLVTNAEVFQEILHRYHAIERPSHIQQAFDALIGLVEEVYPVDLPDVERAKDVLLERWELSARDALHIAVMQRHDIARIFSFDTGFDRVPGIERLS